MAILMHDMQKVFKGDGKHGPMPEHPHLQVSFRQDPLSFLVTLVDQIQDFGRPDARFTPSPEHVTLLGLRRPRHLHGRHGGSHRAGRTVHLRRLDVGHGWSSCRVAGCHWRSQDPIDALNVKMYTDPTFKKVSRSFRSQRPVIFGLQLATVTSS